MHEPITDGDLRDALRGHPRLVEEDPPEVVAVGEDLVLQRQERAARVDEVDAGQVVLLGHLLGAQVLLDRQREVGAALDGRVVGDDHALLALDDADPGHDPGGGSLPVVQLPGGERAELEERAARVEQAVDSLAGGQLPARAVALDRLVAAAARNLRACAPGALRRARSICSRGAPRRPSDSRSTCELSTLIAVSVAGAEGRSSLQFDGTRQITRKSPKVSRLGAMRIAVNPDAREELLEFLRHADCEARADGDGAVVVEVPDAAEPQARLEVDLYLKAWRASRPDVDAHLLDPHSGVEGEAETSD